MGVNKHLKLPAPSSLPGIAKPPVPGGVLDGRYRIVKKIGVGTSGTVYEGVQLSVDRRVAIKILKPTHYPDENYRERFTREAKAIARLSHTNCISLHDFAYSEELGSLYMVMEYVDGVELFKLMKDSDLSFVRALRIAIQIAEALSHAHKFGILHRDLKPENVVIGQEDVVKVLDFGLARIVDLFGDDNEKRLTAHGTIYGTPAYMSPEQCGGELEVTVHSDIYSLGVILYQLFEGRLPFDSREIVAILIKHKTEPPPPMNAPIPNRLRALIFKMLEKDKSDRPNTAYEVADILRAVLLGMAMQKDTLRPDVSQEIQLSFLRNEIDESREFTREPMGTRGQDYGLVVRQPGKDRAMRAAFSGGGKTEHLPGQHLDNRYKIVAEIGSGTMSTVFVAEDLHSKQTVAVKILSADVPAELKAPERFEREIATMEKLHHPNIIRMRGHGFDLSLDRHFIVLDLASGDTLDTLCESNRASLELGMSVARDVTAALEFAHKQGVIHRDLNPSNIILSPQDDGTVITRVLDFGLAHLHTDHRKLTEHGAIPGNVTHLAPERLKGEDATTASDIYSLGVVLYTMLSGHDPFEGRSSVDIAASVLRGDIAPISSFVHEVPEEFSQLLSQMMDLHPSRRPSATHVLQRLEFISKTQSLAPFIVHHKGPASDPQSAWRLRRKVSPQTRVLTPNPTQFPPIPTSEPSARMPSQTPLAPPRPPTRRNASIQAEPDSNRRPLFAIGVVVLILIGLIYLAIAKS